MLVLIFFMLKVQCEDLVSSVKGPLDPVFGLSILGYCRNRAPHGPQIFALAPTFKPETDPSPTTYHNSQPEPELSPFP